MRERIWMWWNVRLSRVPCEARRYVSTNVAQLEGLVWRNGSWWMFYCDQRIRKLSSVAWARVHASQWADIRSWHCCCHLFQITSGVWVRLALNFTNTFFPFYYKIPDKVQFESGSVFCLGFDPHQVEINRSHQSFSNWHLHSTVNE